MKRHSLWLFPVVLILGLIGGAALDCNGFRLFVPSQAIPPDARSDFDLMAEAWNAIHHYYVDRSAIKSRPLTYGAITGMVDTLGDTGHSTFLTPEMKKEEKSFMRGEYKGIGVEVRMKGRRVVILAPLDGSPAQKAGLRPGDVILRINGAGTEGLTLNQVAQRILGPVGTKVTLTVMNPETGGTRTVTMTRAEIEVENVTWVTLPGTKVAHLRIAGFSEGVTGNLKQALKEIQQQKLQALVLDLRNDPGGLLEQAVGSTSQFLRSGNVLLEKNVSGKIDPVPVEPGGVAQNVPLAVLVNRGTASSSEIMAGALQDHDRGPIVGETTFGTGTVLEQFPLSDGSALLLAVMEWLTPDGHTIWHKGITPNDVVALPEGVMPSFPATERNMTPAQLAATGDEQLLRALSLVEKK